MEKLLREIIDTANKRAESMGRLTRLTLSITVANLSVSVKLVYGSRTIYDYEIEAITPYKEPVIEQICKELIEDIFIIGIYDDHGLLKQLRINNEINQIEGKQG